VDIHAITSDLRQCLKLTRANRRCHNGAYTCCAGASQYRLAVAVKLRRAQVAVRVDHMRFELR
jgi:hypothetical protein